MNMQNCRTDILWGKPPVLISKVVSKDLFMKLVDMEKSS